MCGLFFGIDVPDGRAAMIRAAHRGPDALSYHEEHFHGRRLSIGHARLSIIDLSDKSSQPIIAGKEDRHLLVFNGAIYNYVELRNALEGLGAQFRSDGDGEVLLQALIHWGEDALTHLRGMFAFVWLDRATGDVLAARDRFGIKPLYHTRLRNGGLALASEIKQLLPYSSRKVHRGVLFDFLEGGITDHRRDSFFDDIKQLRGGELMWLSLSRAEAAPRIRRWWNVSDVPSIRLGRKEAAHRFGALLEQSVSRHLVSDVSVGSCLSGGLDSSSLVALAALGNRRLQTFTAEFPGTSVDESQYARAVAERSGAVYNAIRPGMDGLWENLDAILDAQDEPFGSSSLYAQWSVFAGARAGGITVMLDGQGADELLAGYHANYVFAMAAAVSRGRFLELRRLAAGYRYLGHDSRPIVRQAVLLAAEYGVGRGVIAFRRARSREQARRDHWLHGPAFQSVFDAGADNVLRSCVDREGIRSPTDVDRLCRLMVQAISLPSLLRFEDRNSMAHGIEARVPFLDADFAEFTLGLGSRHKIVGGSTKTVLRDAMAPLLPPEVLARREKLGFQTPEAAWLSGPGNGDFGEGLRDALTLLEEYVNAGPAQELVRSFLDGHSPYTNRLWRIFIIGRWVRRFGVLL